VHEWMKHFTLLPAIECAASKRRDTLNRNISC
jgi:hypothetical protein